MKIKTFINQYGLLIFVSGKRVTIMFNGLYLKLKVKEVNLYDIDSTIFYELISDIKENTLLE